MHEPDATPEEFADDVEDAFWRTVTPTERKRLAADYARRGREPLERVADAQIRDDLARRDEYVDALVDAIARTLGPD